MNKIWQEVFGNKKVAIECVTLQEELTVRKYFDFTFISDQILHGDYRCLTKNYTCPRGIFYEDSFCSKRFYEWHGYTIISFQEFENLIKVDSAPPIGIMPKCIWDMKRKQNLVDAIKRYSDADKDIPVEWVEELAVLLRTK